MMCLYINAVSIAIFKDVIVAVAAIISIIAVIAGYHAWHREHIGKTEYELARRLLRTAKHFQMAIADIRNPFQFTICDFDDQFITNPIPCLIQMHKNPEMHERKIYSDKLENLSKVMIELDTEMIEAEVLGWPKKLRTEVNKLLACERKLGSAFSNIVNELDCPEKKPEVVSIIASTSDDADENPFTRDIDSAVNNIERELRPYLNRKHYFSWRKNRKLSKG